MKGNCTHHTNSSTRWGKKCREEEFKGRKEKRDRGGWGNNNNLMAEMQLANKRTAREPTRRAIDQAYAWQVKISGTGGK